MVVRVDNATGRMMDVKGDPSHAMTSGYACIKGLQSVEIHHGEQRLLHPLERQPDGSYRQVPLAVALDRIAARIGRLRDEHGGDSVGIFRGTQHYANSTAFEMVSAFIRAFRTRSRYSTMTIDQSAKWVTDHRLGSWAAGRHRFEDADVWLLVGYNPLVSILPVNGFPVLNPTKQMKRAKERGMKFVVIDPRRTETAYYADVFLQPYPGEDPTVLAGIIRILLDEGWHDREFCDRYVNGVAELATAVEPFTPDYVERRAGVAAGLLRQAAAVFAQARRGTATSGTGPDMAPRSNLAEHLVECLNVVCGRFLREGEQLPNPGAMSTRRTVRAEVIAPDRCWETGPKSRVRGLGMINGEKMSGALADEILAPGEGQLRALIVDGGNPVNALPNRARAIKAMASLDLLVTIDPYWSETAQLAHYVLPPTLMFERPDLPLLFEKSAFPEPFAQYSAAVVTPPADSEVVEDWYVFWALAQRMGLALKFAGIELDMTQPPTTDELLALMLRDAQVPLDVIKQRPAGHVFELPPQMVAGPRPERSNNRFEAAPPDVVSELGSVAAESVDIGNMRSGQHFSYRLSVRRSRQVLNTTYRNLPQIRRRMPYNPVWIHPDDLAALGVEAGATATIRSAHGEVRAVLEPDPSMRQGVVSMSHGWGGLPGNEVYRYHGASTNDLVPDDDLNVEPINGMPWFSALPVDIVPVEEPL